MSAIKSLDAESVHRICSGQVIINLANAVKELIENSLDAGAKTIEIRLKNYGSELIEVIDDGPGIDEADFQTITLKHYTSKIQKYDDLERLMTFGFRGEALSSLCALCNLSITTRHANSIKASRIEYDHSGLVKSKTACARSVGTSVALERIFASLPVRHKEFMKNLKREYNKLMHVIQCYCLISEGVKLSCFHVLNDKSTKLMSTHSKNSMRENIIEIFGLSAINTLAKFEQVEPDDETLLEFKVKIAEEKRGESLVERAKCAELFQIEGFVSDSAHGSGRSAPDRQYLYVNKRPCDHSRSTKLINEVFHQFNRTQYPMCVLNFSMDSRHVDVNVTPDKLQMFFKHESELLAVLKSSLLHIYNKSNKNLSIADSSFHSPLNSSKLYSFFSKSSTDGQAKLSQLEMSQENRDKEESDERKEEPAKNKMNEREEKRTRQKEIEEISEEQTPRPKQPKLSMYYSSTAENPAKKPTIVLHKANQQENRAEEDSSQPSQFSTNDRLNLFQNRIGVIRKATDFNDSLTEKIDLHLCNRESRMLDTPPPPPPHPAKVQLYESIAGVKRSNRELDLSENKENQSMIESKLQEEEEEECVIEKGCRVSESQLSCDDSLQPSQSLTQESQPDNDPIPASYQDFVKHRKVKLIEFDREAFMQRHKQFVKHLSKKKSDDENDQNLIKNLKFKTKNLESKEAESELDRCITKEDFLKMRICGQFNKGFIITQLEQDLFIVDQHAADEIYNFETLQKNTKIERQRLLQPRYLDLSPSAEETLIDNLALLEKSGYEMQVCTNRKMGNRIMLTCVPMSAQSNKILNLKDIDELLFVLGENCLNPGSISNSSSEQANLTELKSSSLRAFFASKACRKSVMIGDSLNHKEMRRIVSHLNEIEKPWNCPHGRPTMRHLINLDLFKKAFASEDD